MCLGGHLRQQKRSVKKRICLGLMTAFAALVLFPAQGFANCPNPTVCLQMLGALTGEIARGQYAFDAAKHAAQQQAMAAGFVGLTKFFMDAGFGPNNPEGAVKAASSAAAAGGLSPKARRAASTASLMPDHSAKIAQSAAQMGTEGEKILAEISSGDITKVDLTKTDKRALAQSGISAPLSRVAVWCAGQLIDATTCGIIPTGGASTASLKLDVAGGGGFRPYGGKAAGAIVTGDYATAEKDMTYQPQIFQVASLAFDKDLQKGFASYTKVAAGAGDFALKLNREASGSAFGLMAAMQIVKNAGNFTYLHGSAGAELKNLRDEFAIGPDGTYKVDLRPLVDASVTFQDVEALDAAATEAAAAFLERGDGFEKAGEFVKFGGGGGGGGGRAADAGDSSNGFMHASIQEYFTKVASGAGEGDSRFETRKQIVEALQSDAKAHFKEQGLESGGGSGAGAGLDGSDENLILANMGGGGGDDYTSSFKGLEEGSKAACQTEKNVGLRAGLPTRHAETNERNCNQAGVIIRAALDRARNDGGSGGGRSDNGGSRQEAYHRGYDDGLYALRQNIAPLALAKAFDLPVDVVTKKLSESNVWKRQGPPLLTMEQHAKLWDASVEVAQERMYVTYYKDQIGFYTKLAEMGHYTMDDYDRLDVEADKIVARLMTKQKQEFAKRNDPDSMKAVAILASVIPMVETRIAYTEERIRIADARKAEERRTAWMKKLLDTGSMQAWQQNIDNATAEAAEAVAETSVGNMMGGALRGLGQLVRAPAIMSPLSAAMPVEEVPAVMPAVVPVSSAPPATVPVSAPLSSLQGKGDAAKSIGPVSMLQ